MEAVYRKAAPDRLNSYTFVTRSQIDEGVDPEEHMLLTPTSHTLVAKSLGVPELSGEIERAVRQVQNSLEKEKTIDPARQGDAANTAAPAKRETENKSKQ